MPSYTNKSLNHAVINEQFLIYSIKQEHVLTKHKDLESSSSNYATKVAASSKHYTSSSRSHFFTDQKTSFPRSYLSHPPTMSTLHSASSLSSSTLHNLYRTVLITTTSHSLRQLSTYSKLTPLTFISNVPNHLLSSSKYNLQISKLLSLAHSLPYLTCIIQQYLPPIVKKQQLWHQKNPRSKCWEFRYHEGKGFGKINFSDITTFNRTLHIREQNRHFASNLKNIIKLMQQILWCLSQGGLA